MAKPVGITSFDAGCFETDLQKNKDDICAAFQTARGPASVSPDVARKLQSGYKSLSGLNLYHAMEAAQHNPIFEPIHRYSTNTMNDALVEIREVMRALNIHVPSGKDEI
ncbi:MAG: hypothetical protein AAF542_17965 [Pseudomonadota bacterium]